MQLQLIKNELLVPLNVLSGAKHTLSISTYLAFVCKCAMERFICKSIHTTKRVINNCLTMFR